MSPIEYHLNPGPSLTLKLMSFQNFIASGVEYFDVIIIALSLKDQGIILSDEQA